MFKGLRGAKRSTNSRRSPDLIEVLKLCDAPQEVIEKLRALISKQVKEDDNRFSVSVDVKVYKLLRGVNKMVFRAVADEFAQGATLYETWNFVHEYYSYISRFNKALEYKGWEGKPTSLAKSSSSWRGAMPKRATTKPFASS